MTRRALLLGAAYGTLYHVPQSLDRLEGALKGHGFRHVELFIDLHPERLLAVLARFIALVEPGEPVVVVYVGHADRRGEVGYLRPSPGERAVVGLEVGEQLAALLHTTANVTLILDCCCAAGVLEDTAQFERAALPGIIAAQLAQTRVLEGVHEVPPLDGVVQLLAAAASQNAVEDLEQACGLFSGTLADVLARCVGLEVGWNEVLDEVRLRMRRVDREQTPVLGGRHRRRIPFTERDAPCHDHDFACARHGLDVHLAAGMLAGVALDDRFTLRTLGHPLTDPAPLAIVTEVGPEHAVMVLHDGPRIPDVAALLRAKRVARPRADRPGSRWQRLLDAIADAPRLPSHAFDIRWGRVDRDGRMFIRLPDHDARLTAQDDLWIAFGTCRNEHAFELFFAALHLGPDDRLVHLNPAHPHGLPLQTGNHHALASRFAHPLAATDTLEWRARRSPGEHALICLVSDRPITAELLTEPIYEVIAGLPTPPPACYSLMRFAFIVAEEAGDNGP